MHLRIKILNINDAKKNNNKIFIFVVNLQIQFIINKINFVVILMRFLFAFKIISSS